MLNIVKRYRRGYTGEDIIAQRTLENGQWTTTTERVPNNVVNNQISNRAAVFGNGQSRLDFNVQHILKHKSGLLGADTLQTYGCNAFYREYTPDFMVCSSRAIAQEMVNANYTQDKIVYTRVDIMLEFPGKFYLIPHDVYADAGTTALYLAAFDGHRRIYMLGFDGQEPTAQNNNVYAGTNGYDATTAQINSEKWGQAQKMLFDAYNDVDFVHVSISGRHKIPESWRYCTNLRQITFRQMVLEADL